MEDPTGPSANENGFRLVWEQAAAHHVEKSFIGELESSDRKKPRRITSDYVDDVGGIRIVGVRGKP
jgi:hypothetical protein